MLYLDAKKIDATTDVVVLPALRYYTVRLAHSNGAPSQKEKEQPNFLKKPYKLTLRI
jgi:hypothetical protein